MDRSSVSSQLGFDDLEAFPELIVGLAPRHPLPTLDHRVDIQWVKFDAAAASSGPLRSEEGRAASQKWIQHDVIASG